MKTTNELLKQLYDFCEKRQKEINVSQGERTTGMSRAFEEVKKEIEVKLTVEHALESQTVIHFNPNAERVFHYSDVYISGIVNFEPVENISESRFKKFCNKIKRFFGFKKNKVDSFYIKQ